METPAKSKPMSQDEVHTLVELIQNQKAIFSKETNARKNKEKDESWDYICTYFNAVTGVIRTKDQLKAKWDNLKKAARKRSERIRLNKFKTGGGKPDFIPPDETLEKVGALLGSTCEGFTVHFGGDGVVGESVEIEDYTEETEINNTSTNILNVDIEDHEIDTSVKDNTPSNILKRVNDMEDYAKIKSVKGKKKKLSDNNTRIKRDLSIATYFGKKTEKLELETKKLKLELELLKKKLNKENEDENIDP